MKKQIAGGSLVSAFFALTLLTLTLGCGQAPEKTEQASTANVTITPPPPTKTDDIVDVVHGTDVPDPYRWLEDQESPETRAWIEEQNKHTDAVMSQVPGKEGFRGLYTSLLKTDSTGLPSRRGNRFFFSRNAADQDLSILYMREGANGEDKVLVDPHTMSDDNSVSVGFAEISEDGSHIVYSVRTGGVDEIEMRILNVETGEVLPDVFPTARYFGASLTPDLKGMYYTHFTNENGPRVLYHELGTDISGDKEIFGEGYGPETIAFASLSEDGNWLMAHVFHGSAGSVEVHLKSVANDGPWQTIVKDGKSRNSATFAGDSLLLQTNIDAPNQRLLKMPLASASLDNAVEVLPEQADGVLQSTSAIGGKIVARYMKDVQVVATIYEMDGTKVRDIETGTLGNTGGLSGQWDSDTLYFRFSTFHIPLSTYEHNMTSGETKVWLANEIPVDTSNITVKQVWYNSKDGTRVPMFLIHDKDIKMDGSHPTYLTGYGGFNASRTPSFSSSAVAWVKRGGIYAVANLRGGGEFGEKWHRAGMLESKQNVFDDFIAAAEYLIAEKYTSSSHLAIAGGSNGGLLVGACMNQRPELFAAVVCSYPLLDMVRYHMFMVARFWVPEYGSSEDPEQFKYIHAYSPYHNVKEGVNYPATLFITGDGDTRVAPLHARKQAALVQAKNGGDNPILLRYHIKAGHSGGKPKSQIIDDAVETMSFLMWQLTKSSGT